MVKEVSAETRKLLLHKKVKLTWQICKIEDYVVATSCYKCSRFNHRACDCRGEETCPLCAGSQKLKECTTNPQEYKCTNCLSYNKHNQKNTICVNHTSLDKNCPSLYAILEKQGKTPITEMGPPFNTNTSHCNRIYSTQIKFLQINLKHSRVATNNLMNIIHEDGTVVLCIQEPCVIHNKIAGISRKQNLCIWGGKTPSSHCGHQQSNRFLITKITLGLRHSGNRSCK